MNLCVKGRHDRFYETRGPVGLKVRRQKILTDLSSKSVRNFEARETKMAQTANKLAQSKKITV